MPGREPGVVSMTDSAFRGFKDPDLTYAEKGLREKIRLKLSSFLFQKPFQGVIDKEVPLRSIDLVLTDPMYSSSEDNFTTLTELASCCSVILKQGGYAAILFGNQRNDDLINIFKEAGLTYITDLYYTMLGGPYAKIDWRGVEIKVAIKPVHLFRLGDSDRKVKTFNLLPSPILDKRFGALQQQILPFILIIRDLTKPGDVIFEPFLGHGTTFLAATVMGRQCFSTEINKDRFTDTVENRIIPAISRLVTMRQAVK